MTTLDDFDVLTFHEFLIMTHCNYIKQYLESEYLLCPRPSSLLFTSDPISPISILNILMDAELWNLPASNILEYAKQHPWEVNHIVQHFYHVITSIQEINMPGMFPSFQIFYTSYL